VSQTKCRNCRNTKRLCDSATVALIPLGIGHLLLRCREGVAGAENVLAQIVSNVAQQRRHTARRKPQGNVGALGSDACHLGADTIALKPRTPVVGSDGWPIALAPPRGHSELWELLAPGPDGSQISHFGELEFQEFDL
jgi:hypothetical protein